MPSVRQGRSLCVAGAARDVRLVIEECRSLKSERQQSSVIDRDRLGGAQTMSSYMLNPFVNETMENLACMLSDTSLI